MKRLNNSKKLKIGNTYIGGSEKIAIQSMLNVPSYNVIKNVEQAKMLEKAGCDIIRVAIPDKDALRLIPSIKNAVKIPLVADIHFDYRLAIESVLAGADKIRINPGNIGSKSCIKQIVDVCKVHNVPIRVGVNSGSLEKLVFGQHKKSSPQAMVESAMYHIRFLEALDFNNIVVSLKCSNVVDTVESYKLISQKINYPLHLGVTEAGTIKTGVIKSSIGIGSLLLLGLGDTIRVSLTADPVEEVYAAKQILKYTGCTEDGIEIISCPTCGRTRINIIELANLIEQKLANVNKNIKVAIMGCVVNGPGEAKDADIGIAGGNGCAMLFKKGKVIKKISEENIIEELIQEINKM